MHRHGRENLPGSAPPPAPNFLLDETMDDAAFLQVLPVLQSFRWRHAKDPWEAEAVGKCLGVTREAGCGPDGSDGCPRKVNSGPVSSNFLTATCFKLFQHVSTSAVVQGREIQSMCSSTFCCSQIDPCEEKWAFLCRTWTGNNFESAAVRAHRLGGASVQCWQFHDYPAWWVADQSNKSFWNYTE